MTNSKLIFLALLLTSLNARTVELGDTTTHAWVDQDEFSDEVLNSELVSEVITKNELQNSYPVEGNSDDEGQLTPYRDHKTGQVRVSSQKKLDIDMENVDQQDKYSCKSFQQKNQNERWDLGDVYISDVPLIGVAKFPQSQSFEPFVLIDPIFIENV